MSLLDRYECSISGCTWMYTRPSLPTQAEIDRALQIGPAAAHGEWVRRVDAILREHFESHTLVEWFTEVQQLRAQLAKIGELAPAGYEYRAQGPLVHKVTKKHARSYPDGWTRPYRLEIRPLYAGTWREPENNDWRNAKET